MDSEHWISRLAAAKRFYAAQLGHADRAGMDELDMEGDENVARPDFACPYCYEDHDIAFLVAHLEEDHPFEPHATVTTGAAAAAVPIGGAAAASGGAAAAAQRATFIRHNPITGPQDVYKWDGGLLEVDYESTRTLGSQHQDVVLCSCFTVSSRTKKLEEAEF